MTGDSLYVAHKLPAEVQEHLFVHVVELLPSVERDALRCARGIRPGSGLRWANLDDWHITLAFLGDVEHRQDDPEIDQIDVHGILGRLCRRYDPLMLQLRGAGAFRQEILWVGVVSEKERLLTRGASLRLALDADTTYPFHPHLTLAVAQNGPVDLDPLVARLKTYEGPPWLADRIHLLRSRPGQPVDETVASWPLEGKPR
jgi:2'-5' RNA ligase